MPTTDIFIKTCEHDRDYHRYCLESIGKFCTGFRKVVVVEGEHPQGYLHQQVVKLYADEHTDADFVLITDSDTLFTVPVTPETYLREGKPVWLHTPWTPEMRAAVPWFDVMSQFFGPGPIHSEFMRRQPFMVPKKLLKGLRGWCEGHHGKSLHEYVMSAGKFSEFNVMGFYAWIYLHDKFHWVNTETDELPELTVKQFWSHDPIEKNIEEIKEILK